MNTVPRRPGRRWRWLALVLSVAVLASAAGLVISQRGNRAQAAPATASAAQADLSQMQSALSSGSVSQQAALLVPGFRFAPHSGPVFPAGTKVTIIPGTLHTAGKFGTVTARTSGGKTVTLGLYAAGGHWRLYAVRPASAQTWAAVAGQPATALLAASVSTGTVKNCPDDTVGMANKVPVVLIHGWTGTPSVWGSDNDPASMFYAVDMIPGTWTTAFDYTGHNQDWVDSPYIGHRLVTYLNCLAAVSAKNHGPGKVVVIAHSMGGLATRWAAANGAKDAIGEVITLGTPNTANGLGGLGEALRQLSCDSKSLLAVATLGQPGTSPDCTADPATAAMANYSGQIDALPELPGDIPLHAIAGNETVNSPLGGAMITNAQPSDVVVPVDAALHEPPGSVHFTTKTISCTVIFPALFGPCWHKQLPSNPAAIADVSGYVAAWVHANYGPRAQAQQGTGQAQEPAAQGQQPLSGHPAGPDGNDPLNVVYGFYDALNAHDYADARKIGIAVIGGTDEASWVHNQILQGNASAYVTGKDLTGGTGQEQPGESYEVQVSATVTWKDATVVKDGTVRHYAGTYIVRWDGSTWSITEVNPFQRTSGSGSGGSSGSGRSGQLNGGPAATVHGVVEPSQVTFSGDASNVVDNLTWTGWGTSQATGTGQFEYESCVPDCGHGPVTPYPAQVIFSAPDANREYTQVTEIVSGGPAGGTIHDRSPVTAVWPFVSR